MQREGAVSLVEIHRWIYFRPPLSTPLHRELRILVVDDEPLVCQSVKLMLECDGHSVETAADGEEALALMRDHRFNLVFTDFSMPGMTGADLALSIKQVARECPVVMITAYAGVLPPELPGVDCVLGKPFFREQLRQAIDQVMAR